MSTCLRCRSLARSWVRPPARSPGPGHGRHRADDDLPPGTLGQDARVASRDVRDEISGVLNELSARERRLPQRCRLDREGDSVSLRTYGKPLPGRQARPGTGRAAGSDRPGRRSCLRPAAASQHCLAPPGAVGHGGPERVGHVPIPQRTGALLSRCREAAPSRWPSRGDPSASRRDRLSDSGR